MNKNFFSTVSLILIIFTFLVAPVPNVIAAEGTLLITNNTIPQEYTEQGFIVRTILLACVNAPMTFSTNVYPGSTTELSREEGVYNIFQYSEIIPTGNDYNDAQAATNVSNVGSVFCDPSMGATPIPDQVEILPGQTTEYTVAGYSALVDSNPTSFTESRLQPFDGISGAPDVEGYNVIVTEADLRFFIPGETEVNDYFQQVTELCINGIITPLQVIQDIVDYNTYTPITFGENTYSIVNNGVCDPATTRSYTGTEDDDDAVVISTYFNQSAFALQQEPLTPAQETPVNDPFPVQDDASANQTNNVTSGADNNASPSLIRSGGILNVYSLIVFASIFLISSAMHIGFVKNHRS